MGAPNTSPAPWKTGDCDGFIIWAPGFASTKWTSHEPGPEAVCIGHAECPGWARHYAPEGPEANEAWREECMANAVQMAASPELYDAATVARQAVQAFLDMVNVIQRFQSLPIPAILETAQHNCPIILAQIDAALTKARGE